MEENNQITPNVIVNAFHAIGAFPDMAIRNAKKYDNVNEWVNWQATQAAIGGVVGSAIPVAHLPLIVADIAFLLHKMAYCCWGIGSIHNCKIESKEDFSVILGLYAGEITEDTLNASIGAGGLVVLGSGIIATSGLPAFIQITSKAVGFGAGEFGKALAEKGIGKGAAKLLSKGAGLGLIAATPLIEQISGKIAAKIAAKLGVKGAVKLATGTLGGFVPILGAILAGGVNVYFVNKIAECADTYYRIKKSATS